MAAAREVLLDAAAGVVRLLPPMAVRRLPPAARGSLQLLLHRAVRRRPLAFSGVPTTAGFTIDGSTADLIQRYLYVFGSWEPNLTHWLLDHLRPGDVVVDIGANIGYFSLLSATVVGPTGKVIAFEPVPAIADMLESNARRNGLTIDLRRQAVGDASGTTQVFQGASSNIGRSSTSAREGSSIAGTVDSVRGDDAVSADLWRRIRFVKVDVEGDEGRVLRGLRPLLDALQPGAAVLVEVTPEDLAVRGTDAQEILADMAALGFTPLSVPNSYAPRHYARYQRSHPTLLLNVPAEQTDVVFVKGSA